MSIQIGAGITIGAGVGVGSAGGGGGGGYPISFTAYDGQSNAGTNFQYTPNPAGTVFTGATYQTIYKSSYTSGWDISTYTGGTSVDVSGTLGSFFIADGCGVWNTDGSALQVLVFSGGGMSAATGRFGKLACSTPYDITTITGFTTSSGTLYSDFGSVPRALIIGDSGNKAYFLRGGGLWQVDLATPYDTFSFTTPIAQIDLFGTLSLPAAATGLAITSNGLVGLALTVGGSGDGDVTQFTLGTAWDFNTLNASPTTTTRLSTVGGDITDAGNGGLVMNSTTDTLFVSAQNNSFVPKMYSYSIAPTP
jgi:hypothetical protein